MCIHNFISNIYASTVKGTQKLGKCYHHCLIRKRIAIKQLKQRLQVKISLGYCVFQFQNLTLLRKLIFSIPKINFDIILLRCGKTKGLKESMSFLDFYLFYHVLAFLSLGCMQLDTIRQLTNGAKKIAQNGVLLRHVCKTDLSSIRKFLVVGSSFIGCFEI